MTLMPGTSSSSGSEPALAASASTWPRIAGEIRVVERGDRSRSALGEECKADRRAASDEDVAGTGLGEPAQLIGPAREVEDCALDLGDRREGGGIGAGRLDGHVVGLRVRARPPGEGEVGESRDRVGGVVASGGAHVGGRDDRANVAATEREGMLEQLPADAPRLAARA